MKIKETDDWGAVAYVPSPEGDGVTFFFHKTEERLSQIQIGTELYDAIYSGGEITDVVPKSFDGHHRALQVGPLVEAEVTFESCADTIFRLCRYELIICGFAGGLIGTFLGGNTATLAQAFWALCLVLGAGCLSELETTTMYEFTDVCNNQICCERSLCGDVPRAG